jgi:DNA-binding NarL/FixJ family response regulator
LHIGEHLSRARILLADDHEEFLITIQASLREEYDIVGAVQDGEALVKAAQSLNPDLIISDLTMPVLNGLQAATKLRDAGSSIDTIFLTIHSSSSYAKKAMSVGAKGYVLKIYASEQLPRAIAAVLAGRTFVSPQVHFPVSE